MGNSLIWIPKRLVELGLLNVAALSAQPFIQYCEQQYQERIVHAVEQIRQKDVHIVMLTGPSSSGKTTTAQKIAQQLRLQGVSSAVISLDNFFKDVKDYPKLPNGLPDYESVDALDIAQINHCLKEISETGRTTIPDFDFSKKSRQTGTISISVGTGVVIVEGIHALNPLLTQILPPHRVYRVYAGLREEYSFHGQRILPTRDIRLARRLVRDWQFRGHTPEQTLEMWDAVCEGEDRNIKVFKQEADLLLDTSFTYEPCCFAPVVEKMGQLVPAESLYYHKAMDLVKRFSLCRTITQDFVPDNSMLREFLGTQTQEDFFKKGNL